MFNGRLRRIAAPLAIWLCASLAGGAATAGGADCAWRALSETTRAKVMDAYRRGGLEPARTFNPPVRDVEAIGDHCMRDGGDRDAVIEALFLEAMRQRLADQLRDLGVDPAAAEADWTQGLTPAQRATFRASLSADIVHRPPTSDESAVIARLARPPYLPPAAETGGREFAVGRALLDFDFALTRIAEVERRF